MASSVLLFNFSTATTTPPTGSQVRFNAATPNATTTIWVRPVTTDGIDAYYVFSKLPVGSRIIVQDKNDHTIASTFLTSAAVIDQGTYFEMAVTYQSTTGAAFINSQAILLVMTTPEELPAPPADGGPLDFVKVVITEPLIPLSEAKDHLRITDTSHDAEIGRMTLDAQNIILDYLKAAADPTWTTATLPYPVRAGIRMMLTHLYEHRGDDMTPSAAAGMPDSDIWDAIDRVLTRWRDPALA
jgi:hypothetical protein